MNAVSRSVDIPPPRRGRRELAEDTGVRLGLHIKSAEQAMMAAKTEALRSFGLTVAQYAPCCPCTTCLNSPRHSWPGPPRSPRRRWPPSSPSWSRSDSSPAAPSSDHAKVLIASLTPEGEALVLRADEAARGIEQRMAEAFTAGERQQFTEMLGRVTALLRGDLSAE